MQSSPQGATPMLFSRKPSLSALIELCRALRHSLNAGITIQEVFKRQAKKGHYELRPSADRIALRLQQGNRLTDALKKEPMEFPPLFMAMISLGEETGHLAEIAASLEKYYILQQHLQRRFRSQISLPVIQFVMGVFIVAFVIWILGIINTTPGRQGGLTILGLSGPTGALIFLGSIFGSIGLLFAGYRLLSKHLKRKARADRFFLRIPAIGSCLEALAMSRFTLALELTQESGMSILKSMRYSLQATGNAAYESKANTIVEGLKRGDTLTDSVTEAHIFNSEFLRILAVAEESGRVPEVMKQQCEYYQEESSRKLQALAQMAGWGVWLIYAVFMIIMIFSIARIYFEALKI